MVKMYVFCFYLVKTDTQGDKLHGLNAEHSGSVCRVLDLGLKGS